MTTVAADKNEMKEIPHFWKFEVECDNAARYVLYTSAFGAEHARRRFKRSISPNKFRQDSALPKDAFLSGPNLDGLLSSSSFKVLVKDKDGEVFKQLPTLEEAIVAAWLKFDKASSIVCTAK